MENQFKCIYISNNLYYFSFSLLNASRNCTFGIGDRFTNAHSYLANNPTLRGKFKRYLSSGNISSSNALSRNKNNVNTKRTINPIYSSIADKNISHKQQHFRMSTINSKSSSCLTPLSFNPLISYRNKKNNNCNFKKGFSNKDHFEHMVPTEVKSKIRPKFKTKISKFHFTQIETLPGYKEFEEHKDMNNKRTGKKIFINSDFSYKQNNHSRNINKKNNDIKFTCPNAKKVKVEMEFEEIIMPFKDISIEKL